MGPVFQEDMLAGEEFTEQKYRRKLLPLWMKICTVILMLIAVFAVVVFAINIPDEWDSILEKLKYSWAVKLTMLVFLDILMLLPAGWALFREKRHAVVFASVVVGIFILAIVFELTEEIYYQAKSGIGELNEENYFIFGVLVLLVFYFIRLLRIRHEWEHRISKITGR